MERGKIDRICHENNEQMYLDQKTRQHGKDATENLPPPKVEYTRFQMHGSRFCSGEDRLWKKFNPLI